MAKLTTESPICRKIVLSFLDFLDSVEVAPGVDEEGLEVARECLAEAFNVKSDSSREDRLNSISLVNMFTSLEKGDHPEDTPPPVPTRDVTIDEPSSSSGPHLRDSHLSQASQFPVDSSKEPETFRDELFGQLVGALEKVRYFRNTRDGDDDPAQLERATRIFQDAINEMEKSGCQSFDVNNLAETLKCQGNKAMQSKLYPEAIELYTFAIALSDKKAVFYCNRAAAYTQVNRCSEAITDCLKSIEIDPNYSKAYSRLGLAYYAQGKYVDAINKGFLKALQLDPQNESVKENIRVAEQKLREEEQRQRRTGSQGMPLNSDLMSMFMNMAGNTFPGQERGDEPEIRVGGNINIDVGNGEQMPEELSGALRSMMHMFGGNNNNGRPSGN